MSHVLDERKPLRDSILWRLQSSFYDRINIRCWSDAIVPNFVTSNAFIANCYARNILAFVRDWFLRCDALYPARSLTRKHAHPQSCAFTQSVDNDRRRHARAHARTRTYPSFESRCSALAGPYRPTSRVHLTISL